MIGAVVVGTISTYRCKTWVADPASKLRRVWWAGSGTDPPLDPDRVVDSGSVGINIGRAVPDRRGCHGGASLTSDQRHRCALNGEHARAAAGGRERGNGIHNNNSISWWVRCTLQDRNESTLNKIPPLHPPI